jgi:hypothetical protein
MDRRDRPEWPYKAEQSRPWREALRAALNDKARQTLTFVPVPPSKAKTDPLYDDRLLQVLHGIWPGQATDMRELIVQPNKHDAVHDRDDRPTPASSRCATSSNGVFCIPSRRSSPWWTT